MFFQPVCALFLSLSLSLPVFLFGLAVKNKNTGGGGREKVECYELDFIIKESLGSRHVFKKILSLRVGRKKSEPSFDEKSDFAFRFSLKKEKGKKKEKQSYNTRGAKPVRKLRRPPPLLLFKPSTRVPTMRYYLCTFFTFILLHSFRSSHICENEGNRKQEEEEKEDVETIRWRAVTETKKLCPTI